MLQEIVARLGQEFTLAAEHWIAPYAVRARYGLYQKVWMKSFGPFAGMPGAIAPPRIRRMYGLVLESEIRGVVDAAGFGYGDQLGHQRAERAAANARRWTKQGKRLVFMPQAWGPFENRRVRRAVVEMLSHADLIYARDNRSYESLGSLPIPIERLHVAPDITIGAMGHLPPGFNIGHARAYIVPNQKMISHTSPEAAASYMSSMATATTLVREHGFEPWLLIHDTSGDATIADELDSLLESPLPRVTEEDPAALKGIIGSCEVLIGSRFHALVAALSQGIPVVAMGWSHKYAELLKSFGTPESLVALPASHEAIEEAVARSCDAHRRDEVSERLRRTTAQMRQDLEAVWTDVISVLGSGGYART